MSLFGDDSKVELERVKALLAKSEAARKRLAADLAETKANTAELHAQIDTGRGEIERLKGRLLKTKRRQKGSIERANRMKGQLAKMQSEGDSTTPAAL